MNFNRYTLSTILPDFQKIETKRGLVVGLIATFLSFLLVFSGSFERVELAFQDLQTTIRSTAPSGNTVIVVVDEKSVHALGGYPLSEEIYARLLHKLSLSGSNRIFFDYLNLYPGRKDSSLQLEKVIRKLGQRRLAMPVSTVIEKQWNTPLKKVELKPLQKYSNFTSLVSTDIYYGVDGKIRDLGLISDGSTSRLPTAAHWLVYGKKAFRGWLKIDYGIDLKKTPVYSVYDIVMGKVSFTAFSGKNIIIGKTVGGNSRSLHVPRYGYIHRPHFFALAAETLQQNRSMEQLRLRTVVLITAILSIIFGVLLYGYRARFGAMVLVGLVVFLFFLSFALDNFFHLDIRLFMVVKGLVLTYLGLQICSHRFFVRYREALKSLAHRLDLKHLNLIHTSSDGIVTFALDGNILSMNTAAENLFGIQYSESKVLTLSKLLPDDCEKILSNTANDQQGRLETELRHGRQNSKHLDILFNKMSSHSGGGGLLSIRDITRLKSREARLEHAAHHDTLTELANRAGFDKRLEITARFCEESDQDFAVLLLDLDKFKAINDKWGHHAGDTVLKEIAIRLKSVLRKSDFVARLGGDEFAIILSTPVTKEEAINKANHLVNLISEPMQIEDERIDVGVSIGIAMFSGENRNTDKLLKQADEAMYSVKRSGRNGYSLASHDKTTAISIYSGPELPLLTHSPR